jgi:hypothetical protein
MAGEFEVSFHAGQTAIYNSPARFKVVAAGRRFGKSHFAAYMLGMAALATTNSHGHRLTQEHGVYYVAPTFDQAKRVMWPKLRELLGYASKDGFIARENVNDGWIQLISGRRIYIKGADNPDSLRGIALSYLVLDEYADMKPDTWEMILEPTLMDVKGEALFIGTPKGKNHFYNLFMNAHTHPAGQDPETGESIGGDLIWGDWEAFHFKSMDNPFLDSEEIMRQSANKSREAVRQELEASFVSGAGKHLKPEWFEIVSKDDVKRMTAQGNICVTVDLAGYASSDGKHKPRTDETVICITWIGPEGWYVLDMQHGHWDVVEVAYKIMRVISNPDYAGCTLGIEQGALKNAVGPYLEDKMREFNRYLTPHELKHGNTKKLDRIVWALQGRAQRGQIKLVQGPWNQWFLDQCADLGDPLSHDDGPDALAYADQLASTVWASTDDFEDMWEPMDLDSGY